MSSVCRQHLSTSTLQCTEVPRHIIPHTLASNASLSPEAIKELIPVHFNLFVLKYCITLMKATCFVNTIVLAFITVKHVNIHTNVVTLQSAEL